jgi:hypothetical protein
MSTVGPVRRRLRGVERRTRPVRRQAERVAARAVRGTLGVAIDRLEEPTLARVGGRPLVVQALLVAVARALARRSPDLDTDILFAVVVDGAPRYWTLRTRQGRTSVRAVQYQAPDVTMQLDLTDFLELASGRQSGLGLMSSGRLEVEGNTLHAMALARALAAI